MQADKTLRTLELFFRLLRGERIQLSTFANAHKLSERSISRDIHDIRIFLSDTYTGRDLIFDKERNTYHMTGSYHTPISGFEALTFAKIMLSSRSLRKDEMEGMIATLLHAVTDNEQKQIAALLESELDDYVSPRHNVAILKMFWDLNTVIEQRKKIKLLYTLNNEDHCTKKYIVSPLSVIFSEYYFYLIAFIDGKDYDYPAFFRVDRIQYFYLEGGTYEASDLKNYNVGKMKKCIQFMYAGELMKFNYPALKYRDCFSD